MKTLLFISSAFLIPITAISIAKADIKTETITCTTSVINSVYIPKMREVVDWPDDEIRPYAKKMCLLEKQREALQLSIKNKADTTRTGNWRICKEVIPGNPNPTDPECKTAYAAKVNGLIDQCIDLVSLGHNPHNVALFIDPLTVEVSCLKAVDTSFL